MTKEKYFAWRYAIIIFTVVMWIAVPCFLFLVVFPNFGIEDKFTSDFVAYILALATIIIDCVLGAKMDESLDEIKNGRFD